MGDERPHPVRAREGLGLQAESGRGYKGAAMDVVPPSQFGAQAMVTPSGASRDVNPQPLERDALIDGDEDFGDNSELPRVVTNLANLDRRGLTEDQNGPADQGMSQVSGSVFRKQGRLTWADFDHHAFPRKHFLPKTSDEA